MLGCAKKFGFCKSCKVMQRQERNDEKSQEPTLWPKLRLECAGLNFDQAQLARLNLRFASTLSSADENEEGGSDSGVDRARGAVEQATERLLQRLLCTVADLDARFSSKFLATLASKTERSEQRPWPGKRFHYMLRLDSLSWPPLYRTKGSTENDYEDVVGEQDEATFSRAAQEDGEAGVLPAGWLRVRPAQGPASQTWAEFLTPSGCLRRDRVVERFAMLLSQAAGTNPEDSETDESRVCGSPGKVLDVALMQQLLCEIPPENQLFYGPSEAQRHRAPDLRDFQVAIIHEGGSCPVLLRLGFLSPSLQLAFPPDVRNVIEVRLHIGIALSGWPSDPATFPARLPLHHPLALLAYKSAQNGYFAVAVSPPHNLRCEERRSAWAVWFPGMEIELEEHFCPFSTPRRAVRVLRNLCTEIRQEANNKEDGPAGLLTVNDYTLRTSIWHQIERWTSVNAWEPASLATHVLFALDSILAALKSRHAPHFILPDCNILCQTNLEPALIAKYGDQEEAFDAAMVEDMQLVMDCLLRLHQASTLSAPLPQGVTWDGEDEERQGTALEAALLARWGCALNIVCPVPPEMMPPSSPWIEKISKLLFRQETVFAPQPEHFSTRQVNYLAQLMLEFLRFTRCSLAQQSSGPSDEDNGLGLNSRATGGASEETEDFLFLIQAVIHQALGPTLQIASKGKRWRRKRMQQRNKQQVWREMVCDAVRRESMPIGILQDEGVLVRHLITWLRRATELAPKSLHRRLCNFTTQLWNSSREAVWHLPEWKKHREEAADELKAMAAFCVMLLNSKEGWTGVAVLKDAAEKGWAWAKAAQGELVRSGCLQFVLSPAKGVVRRCDVALAIQPCSRDTSPPVANKPVSRSRTLPAKSCKPPNISYDELTLRLGQRSGSGGQVVLRNPVHQRLRDGSPLTMALDNRRRHGQQFALASLVHAFVAMHRISVLQGVAALLPPHERQPVLDALQKLSRARRQTRSFSASAEESEEKFTMKNSEFPILNILTLHREDEEEYAKREARCESSNMACTILGTCRNARSLRRRHSLYASLGGCGQIFSESPASIRRRLAGAPARHGIALHQLANNGQLTLNINSTNNDTSQIF